MKKWLGRDWSNPMRGDEHFVRKEEQKGRELEQKALKPYGLRA